MKKLRVFRWLSMATLDASLPITARAAGGHSMSGPMGGGPHFSGARGHDSHFTMAASITASLLTTVSFAVTTFSFTSLPSDTAAPSFSISRSSGLASLTGT
jgi:hypothetical protein